MITGPVQHTNSLDDLESDPRSPSTYSFQSRALPRMNDAPIAPTVWSAMTLGHLAARLLVSFRRLWELLHEQPFDHAAADEMTRQDLPGVLSSRDVIGDRPRINDDTRTEVAPVQTSGTGNLNVSQSRPGRTFLQDLEYGVRTPDPARAVVETHEYVSCGSRTNEYSSLLNHAVVRRSALRVDRGVRYARPRACDVNILTNPSRAPPLGCRSAGGTHGVDLPAPPSPPCAPQPTIRIRPDTSTY